MAAAAMAVSAAMLMTAAVMLVAVAIMLVAAVMGAFDIGVVFKQFRPLGWRRLYRRCPEPRRTA